MLCQFIISAEDLVFGASLTERLMLLAGRFYIKSNFTLGINESIKHGYKFQSVVTPDDLVSSLIGPFMGRRGDWNMLELSGSIEKLRTVNGGRRPAHALCLYGGPAYCTVYGIMGPYKNYPQRPRTPAQ